MFTKRFINEGGIAFVTKETYHVLYKYEKTKKNYVLTIENPSSSGSAVFTNIT